MKTRVGFAALLLAGASLWAAEPAPRTPGGQQPKPPTPTMPGRAVQPPPAPLSCSAEAYVCPSGSTCEPIAALPKGQAALGPHSVEAHRCRFTPMLSSGSEMARGPTSCPPGLLLAWRSPQVPPGSVGAATSYCAPAQDACLPAPAGWTRRMPVVPLTMPQLGYTCGYQKGG